MPLLPAAALGAAAAPASNASRPHGVTAAVSAEGLPYLLGLPAGCAALPPASAPLVLFLHGAGESGGAPA